MAGVLIGLAIVAFWLYTLFDVITTPEEEARNVPKALWVVVVLLVPVVGGAFWLLYGRQNEERELRSPARAARPGPPKGPDDDPEFLRDLERRLRDDE
ncbi:PLDc N-terminal domain-containing protein [Nonomuraea sp. NPDC050556]|uniref:PLDc N-terminal domain-containing protein n=1 Tax=Nonomuraea sp. NPDC050556 TaxID=3364369 RepID=UPI0037A790F0